MARGKHGAQAARLRAETAETALNDLQRKYCEEKVKWSQERAALKEEVQQLGNRLVSDVNDLAAETVNAAKAEAAQSIRLLTEKFADRAANALALVVDLGTYDEDNVVGLVRVAKALGVNLSSEAWQKVVAGGNVPDNRRTRRAVTGRDLSGLMEDVERERIATGGLSSNQRGPAGPTRSRRTGHVRPKLTGAHTTPPTTEKDA